MKCKRCGGDGWTEEHDTGVYSHDENGDCVGYCPVQVQCEKCQGTGYIKEYIKVEEDNKF